MLSFLTVVEKDILNLYFSLNTYPESNKILQRFYISTNNWTDTSSSKSIGGNVRCTG